MKLFITITLIVALLSCGKHSDADIENLPLHAKKLTVKLIDSLGWVSIYVPDRYDTSFEWTDESDCGKPCANEKYRFQPKDLEIFKESGFFWTGKLPVSIDRFTVSHSSYIPFHEGNEAGVIFIHRYSKQSSLIKLPVGLLIDKPTVTFDTIQRINGRLFSVIVAEKYDSSITKYLKEVLAITTIKSNRIIFGYELLRNKNDSITKNFINETLMLIKTIRIEKGL